jgi:hypothetical protein
MEPLTFLIKNRDPAVRRAPRGRCIYCGTTDYRERKDRKLGDEHVIAESLGGTLILEQAACEKCERSVNEFEQQILKSVLYAPRVHLGVRRKRRKRGEETIKVQGKVGGKDVEVILPIKNIPVLLFFINFGPPGILVGRPSNLADMRGAWYIQLSSGSPIPQGFQSFASPVLDTFKFCQFLAKIAHCFAVDQLADRFTPLLLDVIKKTPIAMPHDLVGGELTTKPPTTNLHELDLHSVNVGSVEYVVVRIRLFANLGAPTYAVVAGISNAS